MKVIKAPKRIFLALVIVCTLFIYLVFPKYFLATSQLNQVISNYQSWNTAETFNLTLLNQHLVTKKGTLWSKHITKENGFLTFKSGHTLTEEIQEKITLSSTDHRNRQRFIVYRCDSSTLCGGWGDRQKGIVATFLLALLTNRVFVIDMNKPCRLDNFLLPNIYDWSLWYNYVKTVPASSVIQSSYIDAPAKIKKIKDFDFDQAWSKQVVVFRVNSYIVDEVRQHKLAKTRLKWLLNITNEEAIHLVLQTLFKPSEKMLKDASEFYDKDIKGKQLICSHIRIGKNPSIPSDLNLRHGTPNGAMLLRFLKCFELEESNAIYVASDSEEIKQLARKNIKSYININRTIVHVDRLGKFKDINSEACAGLGTVILEQFILSLCDTLILTRSGFGTMAAYIRGLHDNLFIFHPKTRTIVPSNLTTLQKAFKFL